MIEEKLTKSKKDIQNKMSGEEVVPKEREKIRTSIKARQPREKLNLFPVTRKKYGDTCSSKYYH